MPEEKPVEPLPPGDLLKEQAAEAPAASTEAEAVTPGALLAESAPAAAGEAGAVEAAGAAAAPEFALPLAGAQAIAQTGQELISASQTKGSINQYLIAGGGGANADNALGQAVISALNRLAGFRSRM